MSNQEKWVAFCAANDQEVCIYDKPFWLDAVCNGRKYWDVFLVEKDGEILAALPYYIKKRMGLRYITMPLLTQYNGIWMKELRDETPENRTTWENSVYSALVEQIEETDFSVYQQCLSKEIVNWLPYSWKGFKQRTMYTFCISHPHNLAEAERNFSKSTKRNIKRANQAATIDEFDDIELFYQLNCMTFTKQGMSNPISKTLARRLYNACKANHAVKMYAAKDSDGRVCASLFLVYDAMNVYSLMSGILPDKRYSSFMTRLDYEGIKFACETGRNYDFEGSMLKGVADYNRSLGAEMLPYFCMMKVLEKRPVIRQFLQHKVYV